MSKNYKHKGLGLPSKTNNFFVLGLFCFILTINSNPSFSQTGSQSQTNIRPEVYTEALEKMTTAISTVAMHQMLILGTLFDAKSQLETQHVQQELQAIAHKDYHPSDQMCRFGSFVKTVAHTEAKGELDSRALSNILTERMLNVRNSSSSEGPSTDVRARLNKFVTTYCDPKDNNDSLDILCTHSDGVGGSDNARLNKDINFTRTINNALTLDVNFTQANSGSATVEEEDVIALAKNLYWPEVFTVIPEASLRESSQDSAAFQKYLQARRHIAMQNVAQNSYTKVVGMRAKAPADLGNENGGAFMKSMMREFGLEDDDIHNLLGDYPSYNAQMDVLTKKIYQSPKFYTNLYDKPANVERIDVSMSAIGLMNARDHYDSVLRREMLISLLVEQALLEQRQEIDGNLRNAAAIGLHK